MENPDSLSADQQRELLAKLLQNKSANSRIMPVSFAQRRLWFLDRLAPGKAYYNLPIALRLQGLIDVEILQRCFDDLVIRHEALRTTFSARMNEPVQVIRPPFKVSIHVEDLTQLQPTEREQESKRLAELEGQTPFDLDVGPLFRVKLQRLSDDEYLLLLTIHHIVTDGWSNGILFRELSALHQAHTSNVPANLEVLPIQYADFAVWQQQWLSGDELESQIAYWKKRLVDLPDLQLPIDKPRPALQTFNGALAYRELPGDLSVKLRKLSQQSGGSLFMTMLAGFGVLLQRYCGQDDIVVGSPIANRKRVELEGLMGFFVNSLVMRMDVSGDPGFAELLKRVQQTTLQAYEHQDLPFEKLIEELQPERIQSQNPLFQVMFALQNAPSAQLELSGLRLQAVAPFIRLARFDLEVHVSERSGSLGLGFIYNTDLFDAGTIERMLAHYQSLLEAMVTHPEMRISAAPMLSAQERQQIVVDWNQTQTDYPREQTVQALFEAQVAESPDSIAVEYDGDSLGYAELNERANRLAHHLRQRGVGAEVKVGLFVERSLDMVVALLGILKAGGAYVPLDLDYPAARIAFMLDDAEVPVLLTTAKLAAHLPEGICERICLDTDWAEIEQESTHNPEIVTSADSLAYVIYTSGSTGTPKGVEIVHRAINRLVRNTDYYQVDASDRIAQASSVSFDAATFEVWGALLNGGQLVGIDKDTLLNARALAALLREKGITAMFITTAVFNQIAREVPDAFKGLNALMFGGEAVDCNAVRRVLANQPPQRLLHVYGPTESTTFASWYPIESVVADATTVPIGRPLANTTLYVLDANRKPVPVGVSGELYIGGDGLARGYLNRPELTAERFVPNPFDTGSKLYRTGDKVRYLADGAIEFQGRFDHQVKLRGFRIELGEIETALQKHEAVQDAVAMVREDEPGDRRIAAYLVASPQWVEQISSSQSGEHVDDWQALYEETYGNVDEAQDLTRNFTGWNSSYTGEPIPLVEMEEWQASTLARIEALQPNRVLEIGCGTGLLLLQLAPGCERYVGSDFSAVAQRQLREVVSARDEFKNVELWQRTADDFSDVEANDFDTVIINSVTQYLPSMDYLAEVVEGAVAAVAAGGRIMLGDIRSLPLLKAYHTSVQLYLSPDDAGGSELLRNIQQHVEEENELVIEPAFFHALQQRIPRISHVEILLKQGQYHNELSGYRYDVILHVEAQAEALPEHGQWLDWGALDLDAARLRDELGTTGRDWLGIRAMPNARVYRDVAVLEQLRGEGSALSVGELKQAVEADLKQAVEPADLWRLAEATGYQLELSYSGAGTDGRMDALFRRSLREACAVFWPQQQDVPERAWSAYGTNPLKGRLANELIPMLRQDLQQQLPDYMMPSVYVLLDALPLNANGKVERKALPVPGDVRASLGAEYTAPRNAMEQQLAGIWAEVLKLERVGIHDNFFDLGGHSLMATQVVSRIRAQLNVELPLSEMFGYPTVAELAPVIATLLDGSDGEAAEVIPLADRSQPLPLSFAQERLWFLDQLEPGSAAYNMCLSLRLSGELDVAALAESLNTIVDRQQALRTHFDLHQGKPTQVIDAAGIELCQDDLSALASDALDGEVKTRIKEVALQPFDLSTGPLLRGRLLRLSDHQHVLSLAMHHIISDGWSLGVLFRELGACYAAFAEGKSPQLAELPIQYVDFALWQRDWLSGEVLDRQLTYWRQKLEGLTPLELPADRPRPAVKTYNGASAALRLNAKLCKNLEQLSQQAGVTPFMTLLAGFAVLMQRYCGQDDIVIGSPIANRNRSELEQLIGFFINTLVLRLDVSGDPDFRALLDQTQQTTLEAYQHQDIPFERLVEELQPERDRSRNPLFQIQFSLQNAPMEPLKLKGLELEPVRTGTQSTRFDLECHIWPRGSDLEAVFVYNTDLFDAATIETLLVHYQTLLAGIVADPDRPVAELPMLSTRELQQFVDWNQTSAAYPADKAVHELFAAQAALTPDAIAVDYQGESLSYARLNERANQLARYLQARGVGPEVLVGLFLDRGVEMIVGLLGILKAGGAYLPLDLDYPQSRIQFMLEDAGVLVLLSLATRVDALPEFSGELVCLDIDWAQISGERTDNLLPAVTGDNLAYVIYTSGSTGKPKGVEIPHRAINRLVCNTDYYQVRASDRIAQASNVSFDAATFEIWGALLNGAQLAGIDKGVLLNPGALADFLREQGISAMFLTTALFNQIAREMPAAFASLRCLMFGGEAVDPAAVRRVLANQAPQRLLHVYGPTESTTFASWYLVEAVSDDLATVPIGRPLANTTLQVLDEKMNPVPVGVPGELYIGGDGLARGYLNRAELTAQKFIADPRHPQNRLYRTGDRVRYRHNGAIEYLGRFDHQVKLRGFRVELGEIESALLKHQRLSNAIVIVREDDPDNKRLLAYVAADKGEAPSAASLREFVARSLPNYMLPSAFVILEKLPLTANGKLDRKALPVPDDLGSILDTEYLAPRNEMERELAQIWAQVLKLERVGIHDNFFHLGGHSLMATQVVSRIRTQLNVELPLAEMFAYPTVAELSPVTESLLEEHGADQTEVIPLADRSQPLPLSFAQERLWFLDQLEPGSTAYNMGLAVRLKGELSVSALLDSLNAIVNRQQALSTHFAQHQGKPVQVIDKSGIELRQDDLSVLELPAKGPALEARLAEDVAKPFDLARGPLLRGSLLRLSDHEHVLSLTMHHVISDGWSLGVLFGELGKCYAAFSEGKQPQLVDLSIQYVDFAVWQRGWMSGEVLDRQLTYWRQKLENLTPLELPLDLPRPTVKTYNGSFKALRLDAKLCGQLERLSQQAGVTLFMSLLAGFALLMHRYSGQDDIVVGSPIANRNRSELEQLIGFFVNMLVLRLDLSGNPDFKTLLGQVQETTLGAYQHQDIPFERLVEELQPERDRSRNPISQIQFALQNAPMEPLTLKGLELEPVSSGLHSTRFDLECNILPRDKNLDLAFVYNTDLFDADTIERMLLHYRNLLVAIAANPNHRLGELEMLSVQERKQQLVGWNQTAVEYASAETVVSLFENQAVTNPNNLAVGYEGGNLDYAQLNSDANRLAHYLIQHGVSADIPVVVLLPRCAQLIIAQLAVLKAGGAYVPIDPGYPPQRLAFVLADTAAPVLLTHSSLLEKVSDYAGQSLCLDIDIGQLEQFAPANPEVIIEPENLAYIVYTSGSTGEPKGVEVPHRGVTNLVSWHCRTYQLTPLDRATHLAGLGFDATVWELWPCLCSGASIHLVPDELRFEHAALWRWIAAHGITLSFMPTPMAEAALLQQLPADLVLRVLLTGGDRLHGGLLQRKLPFSLVNHYGPSENSVVATCAEVDLTDAQEPPIGRPIDNVRTYILDRYRQPVAVGVCGELYIGGVGLARGYLNQAELTAEKFVPDPFSDQADDRLYRTGDIARYRKDGSIDFVGRIDNQVQLRGFRIELGEIEAVLNRQDGIDSSVAILYEVEAGDHRLVAYLVAEGGCAPSVAELRERVRDHLPEYMVPAAFVMLDKLPLTANGKVDRSALPAPQGLEANSSQDYAPPRSELEQQLAQIWAEVLKLERVGVHDNFFDLGGHSLMATQVVSRIRAQLNVELPLAEMFGYPTVAELAPVIAILLDDSDGSQAEVIPLADRREPLPLSFAQERLWFLDQMEPGNPAYNIPMALRLKGELSIDYLTRTLNDILQRHEALRTRFVSGPSGPLQVIDEQVSFKLARITLSDLSAEARQKELMVQLQEEAIRPFDLATDLLLRATLLSLGEREHVLLLTLHHIIADGWSMGVLFRELGECYAAFGDGKQPQLPVLPIQYADFAVWQRNWLSGARLQRQLGYWSRQLTDLNTLELPTDFVRPALQSYHGAHLGLSLGKPLSARLKAMGKRSGKTLFTTLLGVYALMMHRYSSQDNVMIGSPIANRNRAELEGLIAFFVNMLVLRLDCSGNPTFAEYMERLSGTVMAAFEHQDIPFEKLVDTLQIERDPSRNPMFQVTFALQNAPMDGLELQGLSLESIGGDVQRTRFDLECHCHETVNGIGIVFIYNTSLFEASTIRRMLGHYHNLLESVVANPDLTIDLLPMLDREEEQQLLNWNQAAADYHLDRAVHTLFEAQVTRTPDAVAIEYEAQVLSYNELNERANRLAHYLHQQGVGPEVMVGLYLERGVEMVVGILGILKAGGAYVPLDPDYPYQRLAFMLEDTQLPVLLTQQRLRSTLPNTGAEVVCLDSDWEAIAKFSGTNPSDEIVPDNLAYVLYTSGSTGQPKGVAVPHRAVCNHMLWMQDAFPLTENDKVLQKTPFSFDASVWEFFAPLTAGARLVMARPEGHKDPHYLVNVIAERQITRVQLVPSLLKLLLDEELIESCPSLRHVFCGGEALLPELQKRFFACHQAELCNLYGPTEATIDATFWQCDRHIQLKTVPIGRPIANTNIYILDRHRQPVPIGVPGEMYIGGAGLARGYLNRPELTAERFIAHPFSDQPEARLYRTGDLARYLPDGDIEYLGRVDHQVKLRGFRIELGEIETTLLNHEAVRDAVTIVREDEPGNKRLAAYVVPVPAWIDQLSSSHSSEHVAEWQALYEETYGNVDADLDLTTDFTGWNSSYTGDPIPLEEMTEWLDSTIARIMSLQPERVLEIGCGTGLLLYRLAPACECYVGTDFSAAVQQQVREMVSARDTLAHVELWHRTADDFSGIEAGDFDLVVINSVVQYLPGVDYLMEVLSGAVAGVAAGGQVYVGDLRSFPLLSAYHASVEAHRAPSDVTGLELLRRVQQRVEEENELVVEPEFFHALKQRIPRISHVEVLLKRGEHINELSAFRYDVILHVEAQLTMLSGNGEWHDWGMSGYAEAELEAMLAPLDQEWLGLHAIPNVRTAGELALLEQLQGDHAALALADLQADIEARVAQAVDPARLWRLAESCGYELELGYSGSGAEGCMEALFRRGSRAERADKLFWDQAQTPGERRWIDYASNPIKGELVRELIPQLKHDLRQSLPDYMLPSVFVFLDKLPMTTSGKVDRQALPRPQAQQRRRVSSNRPKTEMEIILAAIWEELLEIEDIETDDTFFDLGGHSLLTIKVIDRFAQQTNVRIPVASFMTQTLRQMAASAEATLEAFTSDSGKGPDTLPNKDSKKGSGRGFLGLFKRK